MHPQRRVKYRLWTVIMSSSADNFYLMQKIRSHCTNLSFNTFRNEFLTFSLFFFTQFCIVCIPTLYSTLPNSVTTTVYSNLTFMCTEGYWFQKNVFHSKATCQPDANWKYDSCIRKYIIDIICFSIVNPLSGWRLCELFVGYWWQSWFGCIIMILLLCHVDSSLTVVKHIY